MTINANINVNAGALDKEQQTGKFGAVSISGKKQEEKKENNPGLMLNGQFDPIEQKKELAKKQAYKIVRDALARELKVDSNMDEVRANTESLQKDMEQAQNKISEINAEKEKWREECGVELDFEEQKKLDLFEKSKAPYEDTVNKAQAGIIADNAVIRGTRLERLKKDYIRKAQNEAEDVLAAAGREVMGMLVGEAKDHMDEKSKELQEKAEERAEKKEEQQEQLDAARERREEMEALADPEKAQEYSSDAQPEPVTKDPMTEVMTELDSQREDYQREIEEMMRKMKLITEDIKGVKVDEILK